MYQLDLLHNNHKTSVACDKEFFFSHISTLGLVQWFCCCLLGSLVYLLVDHGLCSRLGLVGMPQWRQLCPTCFLSFSWDLHSNQCMPSHSSHKRTRKTNTQGLLISGFNCHAVPCESFCWPKPVTQGSQMDFTLTGGAQTSLYKGNEYREDE